MKVYGLGKENLLFLCMYHREKLRNIMKKEVYVASNSSLFILQFFSI